MSDIGINYSAVTQPSQVGVRFKIRFENAKLRASVKDIDTFVIRLTPSGNVSEMIMSGIVWPLAQTIGAIMPQMATQIIGGQTFDIMEITPSTHEVAGDRVTVSPGDLSLSNFGDMMMVQGTLNIS